MQAVVDRIIFSCSGDVCDLSLEAGSKKGPSAPLHLIHSATAFNPFIDATRLSP